MKRFLALLVCLCLLLPMTAQPQPVNAAGATVVFTMIDDIFTRNLTTATMPARIDGTMYISYLYLLRLVDLTCERSEDILTVHGPSSGLIYDLRTDTVTDLNGNLQPMTPAIRRNGGFYLPVQELCAYFGYYCSIISSSGLGEIIRIDRQQPVVSDTVVVNANIEVLRQIYVDYQLTASQDPVDPDQPVDPQLPVDPNPPIDPDPPVVPDPPQKPERDLFLYFEVTPAAMTDTLQLLETRGLKGTFFVRPEHILSCADYLRRLVIGGHELALLVEGTQPAEKLAEGNALLYAACLKKTRIAHVRGADDAVRTALQGEGWRLWSWSEDSGFDAQTVAASVITTMRRLDKAEHAVVLRLGCDDAGYQTLTPILFYAESNRFICRTIRPWTDLLES